MNGILDAIKVNSVLWGGSFNPIVPSVEETPALWRDRIKVGQEWTAESLFDGFLDAFDPDALIVFSAAKTHGRNLEPLKQISPDDLTQAVLSLRQSRYGVNIYETAVALVNRELRSFDRDPIRLVQPKLDEEWKLLEALLYGIEPDDFDNHLDSVVGSAIRIERPKVTLEESLDFIASTELSVRRLGGYDLSNRRRPIAFYLLDAHNQEHALDFLTLRAQNHNIVPVPVQTIESQRFQEAVRKLNSDERALFFIPTSIEDQAWQSAVTSLALPNSTVQLRNFLTPISRGKTSWARIGRKRSLSVPLEDGALTIQLDQPFDGDFDVAP